MKSIGLWPRRSTSSGLRPPAARPSEAQPVKSWPEAWPDALPKPPSVFCALASHAVARPADDAAGAAAGSASSSRSTAPADAAAAGAQRTSNRRR